MEKKYWLGPVPKRCDVCGAPICGSFVDGRTSGGAWGFMDEGCHAFDGVGFGVGRGQRYARQEDGRWLKTAG